MLCTTFFSINSMTDSAIGHSTVTSPIIGHPQNNICDDAVQMLSPNIDRGKVHWDSNKRDSVSINIIMEQGETANI